MGPTIFCNKVSWHWLTSSCHVFNDALCLYELRLGATPSMELMIVAGKAVAQLQLDHGLAVERVYTGSFMTSLDMKGNTI